MTEDKSDKAEPTATKKSKDLTLSKEWLSAAPPPALTLAREKGVVPP